MSRQDAIRQLRRDIVLEEVIDGEVIAINSETGAYYSVRGTGVPVWERLRSGSTISGLVDDLVRRYDADASTVEPAVQRFIEDLTDKGLLAEPGANGASMEPLELPADRPRAPFTSPVLEVYTDMQDLLLLDPIHEVDESGWPNKK